MNRSLAEEITEGFDALEKIRQLEAEIAELKNARDYWCLQYKDVFNKSQAKIDEMAGEIMSLENRIGTMTGYGHN